MKRNETIIFTKYYSLRLLNLQITMRMIESVTCIHDSKYFNFRYITEKASRVEISSKFYVFKYCLPPACSHLPLL